jgi:hypothetical protein
VVDAVASPDAFVGGPEVGDLDVPAVDPTGVQAPEPDPLPGPGAWVVRSNASTLAIWSDTGASASIRFAVAGTNPWGQEIEFPVTRAAVGGDGGAWYRVLLGVAPNGSDGWVRATDVTVSRSTDRIVVDMSKRILRHFHDGKQRHRFRIGIGKPSTPTTPGTFFVWAHLDPSDSSGPYGSYLLGLSGFSDVLTDWPGGGRMALHGTDDPTDRGGEVSFGCVRVFNPQMEQLRTVPMGTVVVIHR